MTEQSLTKSTRKRRIAAFLIDYVVISFLIVSMLFVAMGPKYMDVTPVQNRRTLILWTMIFGFSLYLFKDCIKGASPGKWIMGIIIRNEKNIQEIPSFPKLFLRNLFLIIAPVEFLVLVSSNEKSRWGDKITKTVVLSKTKKPKKFFRFAVLICLGITFPMFIFLFATSAIKHSLAYNTAVHTIEKDQEILRQTGGITGYGIFPTGTIHATDEVRQAQLEIKVIGKTKNLKVSVFLESGLNEPWKVLELNK